MTATFCTQACRDEVGKARRRERRRAQARQRPQPTRAQNPGNRSKTKAEAVSKAERERILAERYECAGVPTPEERRAERKLRVDGILADRVGQFRARLAGT